MRENTLKQGFFQTRGHYLSNPIARGQRTSGGNQDRRARVHPPMKKNGRKASVIASHKIICAENSARSRAGCTMHHAGAEAAVRFRRRFRPLRDPSRPGPQAGRKRLLPTTGEGRWRSNRCLRRRVGVGCALGDSTLPWMLLGNECLVRRNGARRVLPALHPGRTPMPSPRLRLRDACSSFRRKLGSSLSPVFRLTSESLILVSRFSPLPTLPAKDRQPALESAPPGARRLDRALLSPLGRKHKKTPGQGPGVSSVVTGAPSAPRADGRLPQCSSLSSSSAYSCGPSNSSACAGTSAWSV